MSYLYPPRTELNVPKESMRELIIGNPDWTLQYKYNDTRTLIKITPEGIELWNRHASKIRNYTPTQELTEQFHQLRKTLQLDKDKTHLLDGGLLDSKHPGIKDTIIIWDILIQNNHHLLGTTYTTRHNTLTHAISPQENKEPWIHTHKTHTPQQLGEKITNNINLTTCHQPTEENWNKMWEVIKVCNTPYTDKKGNCNPLIEGIIAKNTTLPLTHGFKQANNTEWSIKTRVKTGRHNF